MNAINLEFTFIQAWNQPLTGNRGGDSCRHVKKNTQHFLTHEKCKQNKNKITYFDKYMAMIH